MSLVNIRDFIKFTVQENFKNRIRPNVKKVCGLYIKVGLENICIKKVPHEVDSKYSSCEVFPNNKNKDKGNSRTVIGWHTG